MRIPYIALLLPRTASAWFVYLRQRQVSQYVSKAFLAWLDRAPENAVGYEDREAVWELTRDLKGRPALDALLAEADRLCAGPGRADVEPASRRRAWITGAIVASAVAGLAAVCVGLYMTRATVADFHTAKGEQQTVELPDGSTVTLDTSTQLSIRFTRSVRSVDLRAGEAVFRVKKDAARPFEVHALQGLTRAVGTEFSVRRYDDHVAVDVLGGTVSVGPEAAMPMVTPLLVTGGEAVDYRADGSHSPLRRAERQRIDAWLAHRIVFDNTPLGEALAEYNRYARKEITLDDGVLRSRRIHGVFAIGDENAFIHALEQGLPLTATVEDERVVLRPR